MLAIRRGEPPAELTRNVRELLPGHPVVTAKIRAHFPTAP